MLVTRSAFPGRPASPSASARTAGSSGAAPGAEHIEQRVHPGRDWFFVITGRVRLSLGERDILVEAGESAEFSTMIPHAMAAVDGPAELIAIFDRDGQRAHVHHETVAQPADNGSAAR